MKIAVAVDGSENALRAAEHAIMLAQHLPEAHLEVIFVADYNKAKDEHLLAKSPENLSIKREKKVRPILELAKAVGIEAEVIMLRGNPSLEIIKYVKEHAIDQLVIGSRGLNSFQEMLLGSVSHKVVKTASCPVTVVK